MILQKRQCAMKYGLQCALLHPFAHQWHFLATSSSPSKLSAHHHHHCCPPWTNIRYSCYTIIPLCITDKESKWCYRRRLTYQWWSRCFQWLPGMPAVGLTDWVALGGILLLLWSQCHCHGLGLLDSTLPCSQVTYIIHIRLMAWGWWC